MKYTIPLVIAIILIVAGFVWWTASNVAVKPIHLGNGTTTTVPAAIQNFADCVAQGYPVVATHPAICHAPSGATFTENVGTVDDKSDVIRVTAPLPNSMIGSPVTVTGEARGPWFFEASFPVRVEDTSGHVLGTGVAQATSDWMTENFVPFTTTVSFSVPTGTNNGFLVLKKDNPSGLPEHDDELRFAVTFVDASSMQVKAFFHNQSLDTDPAGNCEAVFPVVRQVPKTAAVARAALEALFAGPTDDEKAHGYATVIHPGVRIQSLTIVDSVAHVDLSSELDTEVAGSCRVSGIRTEIEQTLQQFTTVRSVVISVNGRTQDILQP